MRKRAVVVAYVVTALVTAPVAVLVARAAVPTRAAAAPGTVASATPTASPDLHTVSQPMPPGPVIAVPANPAAIKAPAYASYSGWALLDRHTGTLTGSANRETGSNTTESMIKVWIAADWLRHQGAGAPQAAVDELYQMIIHSDDAIAHKYYELNGGDASIAELVKTCRLRGTQRPSLANSWSYTSMSPADA